MCRIFAYLGPETALATLLLDPVHSLEVQSYRPREMATALMNADGFGVAWYTPRGEAPARYRSVLPMWADENFPELARALGSGCVLANVRSATPGVGFGVANTQPFVRGRWSFTHNGYLEGFRAGVMRPLRASLGDAGYGAMRGTSDSEHLFALFIDALDAGATPADALVAVRERCRELLGDRAALLSLAATDGDTLVALRSAIHADAPTLYQRQAQGAHWLASEPPDEAPEWRPVPVDQPLTLERIP